MREIQKGDRIHTPRFCTVHIESVFADEKEAREKGFTEPTHYHRGGYGICGKSIGINKMIFAAFRE